MRLIDANALIEDIDGDLTDSIAEGRAIEKIMNAPTIEDRKTGKWIVMETAYDDTEAKCSECGFTTLVNEPGNGLHMLLDLNYCPNCGADMRGEGHE